MDFIDGDNLEIIIDLPHYLITEPVSDYNTD